MVPPRGLLDRRHAHRSRRRRARRATASKEFRVWSQTRPTRHLLADVEARAHALAAGLAARGVRPGDVVAFQLPNCVEAGITFFAAALLGVVLVPVVHFYGHHELGYILRGTEAKVLITMDRFGRLDYLAGLEQLRPDLAGSRSSPSSATPAPCPRARSRSTTSASTAPPSSRRVAEPDSPAVIGFTSGTTADPKGVIHTHRTMGGELYHMTSMSALPARAVLVGAPVGHAIGMQGGLLSPLLRDLPVHLHDVWDPGRVLAAMVEATADGRQRLHVLPHEPARPSRLHARSTTTLIGRVGLGGSPVPAAVGERAESLGIGHRPLLRLDRAPVDHRQPVRRAATPSGSTPTAGRSPGVEMRLVDEDGNEVGDGEPGEIVEPGARLASSGYTDPSLTAAVVDADGWFSTRRHRRARRRAARSRSPTARRTSSSAAARTSAPRRSRSYLVRMPGVAEVAVVAAPDARLGEHACAFLRMLPESAADAPDITAVRAHLEACRVGPPEVAGRTALRRRVPAHRVRQGAEVRAARPAPPRGLRPRRRLFGHGERHRHVAPERAALARELPGAQRFRDVTAEDVVDRATLHPDLVATRCELEGLGDLAQMVERVPAGALRRSSTE